MYACTKEAPKAQQKKQQTDEDERLFSISEDKASARHVQYAGQLPWIVGGASVSLIVTTAAMVLRKRLIQRGEEPSFEEAGDESS